MTAVVVLLLGTGVLFIASSLDGSSLVDTFQKIMKGEQINWKGTK